MGKLARKTRRSAYAQLEQELGGGEGGLVGGLCFCQTRYFGVDEYEEDVLCGIEDVVGADVPIVGGSAADNTVEGYWRQSASGEVYVDGVVVTATYPSTAVHYAFRNGNLMISVIVFERS